MAYHKNILYSPSAELLASQTIGINYPSRSKILIDLFQNDATSEQLIDGHKISKATLIGHLKKLINIGYITVDKFRLSPIYKIQSEAIPPWLYYNLSHHPEANIPLLAEFIPSELKDSFLNYTELIRN